MRRADSRALAVGVTEDDGLQQRLNILPLLDEIRRRSGELARPLEELDYLKRLLQMF